MNKIEICPYCGGDGITGDKLCIYCKATGKVDWIDNIFTKDRKDNLYILYTSANNGGVSDAFKLRQLVSNNTTKAKKLLCKIISLDIRAACSTRIYCNNLSPDEKTILFDSICKSPKWSYKVRIASNNLSEAEIKRLEDVISSDPLISYNLRCSYTILTIESKERMTKAVCADPERSFALLIGCKDLSNGERVSLRESVRRSHIMDKLLPKK